MQPAHDDSLPRPCLAATRSGARTPRLLHCVGYNQGNHNQLPVDFWEPTAMSTKKKWAILLLPVPLVFSCWWMSPCVVHRLNGDSSKHQLQVIGAAIRHYHEVNGSLPPTTVYDKNGQPLYSWRVLLLPFLAD